MSKHLMAILLILSLAFNLAVLGMFVYTTTFHKPLFAPPGSGHPHSNWEHRGDRMSPDSLFKDKDEIRKLRNDFRKAKREFVNTMTKPKFDEKASLQAMELSLQAQDKLERKLATSLIEVRRNMTPAEAKKFFEHRLNRMQRFDRRNGFNHREQPEANNPPKE